MVGQIDRRFRTLLVALACGVAIFPAFSWAQSARVALGRIDGAIGPATKDYAHRIITDAAAMDATCLIIEIDTPGGLSSSMRDIIKDMLASPVPVVVYVSPSGARAASAGALIMLASHVAAMTPGTNIGAAHPVSIGGGETNETMEKKITNDAAAYARGLANQRGRNVEWAEKVVRESISSTAEEALADTVIEFVSVSLQDLMEDIDGLEVTTTSGPTTIRCAAAEIVSLSPTRREKFLAWLSDPNIAYLLMLLGVFGIVFEVQNPGAIFPAVIGAIALLLSAFALQMLPVNLTGLALIVLAIILFLVEIKVPSHGVLSAGGVVAMIFGSIMLIDSPVPFMKVSLSVIIPAVVVTAAFFIFAVGLGLRAQRRKVATGAGGLAGESGIAQTDIGDSGTVFVQGEIWKAFSRAPIAKGAAIRVVSVDGLKVLVEEMTNPTREV